MLSASFAYCYAKCRYAECRGTNSKANNRAKWHKTFYMWNFQMFFTGKSFQPNRMFVGKARWLQPYSKTLD